MLQGFNTGNAWGNFITAQGAGHRMVSQGIESLGEAFAKKLENDEKLRLQGIKDAEELAQKQIQGQIINAISNDDEPGLNNLLINNPDQVKFASDTQALFNPELNYNANIAYAQYVANLPDAERKLLIESGVLKPHESLEEKLSYHQGKTDITTEATGEREKIKKNIALSFDPKIKAAQKQAEMAVKNYSETKSNFENLQANMPHLTSVVNQLKTLAKTATYTKAGLAIDIGRRELGLEPTQGAVDRAAYQSIVSNNILPLLKLTFGSAFTEAEGNKLERTLGDPNLSPKEKIAQLDAFITQKQQELLKAKNSLESLEEQRNANSGQNTTAQTRESGNSRLEILKNTLQENPNNPNAQNIQAEIWLLENPDDPRAASVRKKLGL